MPPPSLASGPRAVEEAAPVDEAAPVEEAAEQRVTQSRDCQMSLVPKF